MNRLLLLGFLVSGVLGLALVEGSVAVAADALSAAQRVAQPRVLIIAHRGDSKVAPENTLPAFHSAVAAGADLVELDYYHSADGVPVVFHDETLDRTTNAQAVWGGEKIGLEGKRLTELQTLDAGSWFAERFAGTRIPTLAESIDVIQNGSMTLIERKGGDPAACVEMLKSKNLLDGVVVQSFDWDYLAGCRKLAPTLVIAALGHKELTPARLDEIATTGASIVGWEDKTTTKDTIAAIHDRGWKAWVWTVDDPQRMRELVAARIDGIITNRPKEARQAIETAGAAR